MLDETVAAIIDDFHTSKPLDADESGRYPGEGMLRTRQESLEKGVLVDEEQWQALLEMSITKISPKCVDWNEVESGYTERHFIRQTTPTEPQGKLKIGLHSFGISV